MAPPAGGAPDCILRFGDNGTPYSSSNDLSGAFLLNQLQFEVGPSGQTNQIVGGLLMLTNNGAAGARLDVLSGGGGVFVVSNRVRLTTDTACGGSATTGILTLSGTVTNLGVLTHNGLWTLGLGGGNDLSGPLIVDSPGGILKPSGTYPVNVLNGSGAIIVSNGMIQGVAGQADSLTFANGKHNRQGGVTGGASVWSNSYSLTIANNATNVRFVVDAGRLYENNGVFFTGGSIDGIFVITNGGQVAALGNNLVVGNASINCRFVVTGSNSSMRFNQDLVVAAAGGAGNRAIVEKGALLWGGNNFTLQVGSGSTGNECRVSDGGVVRPYGLLVGGVSNAVLITGPDTLVASSGANVSSVGMGSDWGNTLTVDDSAVASNLNLQVAVGGACSNTVLVSRGGRLLAYATAQYVAYGTNAATCDNSLNVTGTGSIWNVRGQAVCVGAAFSNTPVCGNRLLVQDGGVVSNVSVLVLAFGTGASNNSVVVDGGSLYAGTITTSNDLPNRFELNGFGEVTPGWFVATNTGFSMAWNGGTMNLKNALVGGDAAQVVGDGSQPATLNVLPGGTNAFTRGLVITNCAFLGGAGLIAATSVVYGVLSPGFSEIGALTNRGAFTLAGNAAVRIDMVANTTPGSGWDALVVTNGALDLGGAMSVVLDGGFLPTNTQRFAVMTNLGPDTVRGGFTGMPDGAVPVYTNAGGKVVGYFKMAVGPRDVTLHSYKARSATGTVLFMK